MLSYKVFHIVRVGEGASHLGFLVAQLLQVGPNVLEDVLTSTVTVTRGQCQMMAQYCTGLLEFLFYRGDDHSL